MISTKPFLQNSLPYIVQFRSDLVCLNDGEITLAQNRALGNAPDGSWRIRFQRLLERVNETFSVQKFFCL